jgi:pantoate kinase
MEQISAAFPTGTPGDPFDFFRICRQFAENSGLITPEVRTALGKCDDAGVPASMTMLGNGIFACGKKAGTVLASLGSVYELRVSEYGVRIVGELP